MVEQFVRLDTAAPDGTDIYPVEKPHKPICGLRVLRGNMSPEFSAVLKLTGVENGLDNNRFVDQARIFDGEQGLYGCTRKRTRLFQKHNMVIVCYEGPSAVPGMPEMLDSASCRAKTIFKRQECIQK